MTNYANLEAKLEVDSYLQKEEWISLNSLKLSKKITDSWSNDLLQLGDLARKIAQKYRNKYYSIRNDYEKVVDKYINKSRGPIIMRPDGILIDNQLKILEINCDSAIGGIWEMQYIQKLFSKETNSKAFPLPIDALVKFLKKIENRKKDFNVAIVGSCYLEESNKIKVLNTIEWLNKNNINAFYVHSNDLLIKSNKTVYDKNREYHIIYRYRSLLHPQAQTKEMINLLERVSDSNCIVLSDPIDLLVEQKGIIALLSTLLNSNNKNGLAERDRDLIKKYIPWTRFLSDRYMSKDSKKIETKEFLYKNKEILVLKRMHSHHGDHVFIGNNLNDETWKIVVNKCLQHKNEWVVQELLQSADYEFEYKNENNIKYIKRKKFVISPYFFGNDFGGALIRVEHDPERRILSLPSISPMGLSSLEII